MYQLQPARTVTMDEDKQPIDSFAVASRQSGSSKELSGIVIGRLAAVGPTGLAWIELPRNGTHRPLRARTLVPLDRVKVGAQVALMFENGDVSFPIIVGILQRQQNEPIRESAIVRPSGGRESCVEIDGERVVLAGEREVVLRCGKASITLRRDGKVVIRGVHLLSRSSGPNRIKGGSVQIN